jgi:adenine-specific DNA-methyltransferase
MHDFILCYTKNKSEWNRNLLPRNDTQNSRYKNPDKDKRGDWKSSDLSAKRITERDIYEITTPSGRKVLPPKGRSWVVGKDKFEELVKDNRIWFGTKGNNVPSVKKFINEVQDGTVPVTLWLRDEVGDNQEGRQDLKSIFHNSNTPFDTPKPSRLIERTIKLSSSKNDIILDSFAGSGTTAHAVLNLNKEDGGNRKFILIEMEDYANTITAERVKRVANGYGKDKKVVKGTGGTFDFYELGLPLFDEKQNLNEEVDIEKIREYIWFSETRTSYLKPTAQKETKYFLGKKDVSIYYFIYEKDSLTTLDFDALELIKTKGEQYVIYADNCLLPKDFMAKKNIIFKKIPRDITRF